MGSKLSKESAPAEGAGTGGGDAAAVSPAPPDSSTSHDFHQMKALRYNVKKKAMAACGDLHGDLLDCFQKASMFTFKPICQDENNAFWECYKRERGMEPEEPRKMSFRQMFDDTKAYVEEQWGAAKGKDPESN